MATLQKDPISGSYQVKPGDSLSKIASTQGRTLQELITANPQYASNPNLIRPGETVNLGTPSYSNLTSNAGATPSVNTGTNPTTKFTTALIQILKEAQGRDTAGQGRLMKQSQDITGQGITDADRNFSNPLLAPSAGTSLGMSAQNQFDPLQLSIANQQKLASQNLDNFTTLVDRTQDTYDKEQERIERAEEKRLDRLASAANKNATFDSDAEIRRVTAEMVKEKGADGYVSPEEWMAARDLWGMKGGTDASFETSFKRFLNPASYTKVGYTTDETSVERLARELKERQAALQGTPVITPTPKKKNPFLGNLLNR